MRRMLPTSTLLILVGFAFASAASAAVREYWLKAEEILWDYTPSYPTNLMTGQPFNAEQRVFLDPAPDRIGHIYRKAVYRSYTPHWGHVLDGPNEVLDPATGQRRILRPAGSPEEHLGLLGPLLRAEVGDVIVVHFRNETRFPVSVHPHGVFYLKDSEGTPYDDGTSGADKADDAVPTGGQHTYTWGVPLRAGPGPADPDSLLWEYHSHTNETADTNAGLIGPMIIYKNGKLDSPTPQREFVNLFNIYNENSSTYLDVNIAEFTSAPVDPDDPDFQESNLMHSINGLLSGEPPGSDHARRPARALVHLRHGHGGRHPHAALARLDGGPQRQPDRRDGDLPRCRQDDGHDPRRPGNVDVPLPRQRPHRRRHDDQLRHPAVAVEEGAGPRPASARVRSRSRQRAPGGEKEEEALRRRSICRRHPAGRHRPRRR